MHSIWIWRYQIKGNKRISQYPFFGNIMSTYFRSRSRSRSRSRQRRGSDDDEDIDDEHSIDAGCECLQLKWQKWIIMQHISRGDLLRSVPCVTVWHKKIKIYTLSAGEKSIQIHLVYVPMIMKNIRGHLPELSCEDTEVVYNVVCHTVTFFEKRPKKHPIAKKIYKYWNRKYNFKRLVALNILPKVFSILQLYCPS